MSNPSKQKGTAYETELVRYFELSGYSGTVRTPAGSTYDIDVPSDAHTLRQIEALATRPDRGRTLVTITLSDFADLLDFSGYGARVEAKRYTRFALHTIFEKKFPKRPKPEWSDE